MLSCKGEKAAPWAPRTIVSPKEASIRETGLRGFQLDLLLISQSNSIENHLDSNRGLCLEEWDLGNFNIWVHDREPSNSHTMLMTRWGLRAEEIAHLT